MAHVQKGKCANPECDNPSNKINFQRTLCKDCEKGRARKARDIWIEKNMEVIPASFMAGHSPYLCNDCGALVLYSAAHYEFHQRLKQTASTAGQAMSHHVRY